jgi:hypothetical protein
MATNRVPEIIAAALSARASTLPFAAVAFLTLAVVLATLPVTGSGISPATIVCSARIVQPIGACHLLPHTL